MEVIIKNQSGENKKRIIRKSKSRINKYHGPERIRDDVNLALKNLHNLVSVEPGQTEFMK